MIIWILYYEYIGEYRYQPEFCWSKIYEFYWIFNNIFVVQNPDNHVSCSYILRQERDSLLLFIYYIRSIFLPVEFCEVLISLSANFLVTEGFRFQDWKLQKKCFKKSLKSKKWDWMPFFQEQWVLAIAKIAWWCEL